MVQIAALYAPCIAKGEQSLQLNLRIEEKLVLNSDPEQTFQLVADRDPPFQIIPSFRVQILISDLDPVPDTTKALDPNEYRFGTLVRGCNLESFSGLMFANFCLLKLKFIMFSLW